MKTFIRWMLVSVFGAALAANAFAQDTAPYVLGVGDVISIHVLYEPDMSFDRVQINDTGMIPFPYLVEVKATGKTITQLKQDIVKGLVPDYLVDPIVDVSVVEYRPFYLYGEVNKPGAQPYSPGLTLRQAISLAGGLTERASESKMTVIPAGKAGDTKGGSKSKDAVKVGMDYLVKPGDTITIEQSFF